MGDQKPALKLKNKFMSTATERQPTTKNSDLPTIAERSRLLHAMPLLKNKNGSPTAAQSGGRSHSPKSSSALTVKSFSTANLPPAMIPAKCSVSKNVQGPMYANCLVGRDRESKETLKQLNASRFRRLSLPRGETKFGLKLKVGSILCIASIRDELLVFTGTYTSGIGFIWISRAETRELFKMVTIMIVSMIAVLDANTFALTADSGAIVLYTHSGGSNLKIIASVDTAHTARVPDICVFGDLLVSASLEKNVVVTSVSGSEKLATLRAHKGAVFCVDICQQFIASGSSDRTVCVYKNSPTFELVAVLEGVHSAFVKSVSFIGDSLLMSVSGDGMIAFTSLNSLQVIARVDVGLPICKVAFSADGHIACRGYDAKAFAVFPPAIVADDVKAHAEMISRKWDSSSSSVGGKSGQNSDPVANEHGLVFETSKSDAEDFEAVSAVHEANVAASKKKVAEIAAVHEANVAASKKKVAEIAAVHEANVAASKKKVAEIAAAVSKSAGRVYQLALTRIENEKAALEVVKAQVSSATKKVAAMEAQLKLAKAEADAVGELEAAGVKKLEAASAEAGKWKAESAKKLFL